MNDFLQSLRNGQADKQRPQKTRKSYDNSYHYTSPRFHNHSSGYPGTRSQQMKRPPAQHQNPNQHKPQTQSDDSGSTNLLAEAIETLNTHIEMLNKNQEFLINAQERAVDMMERQAEAIEEIVKHLQATSGRVFKKADKLPKKENFRHHFSTAAKKTEDVAAPAAQPQPQAPAPAPTPKKAEEPVAKTKPAAIRRRKKVIKQEILDLRVEKDSKLLPRDEIMGIINSMRKEGATFDDVAKQLTDMRQPRF